MQLGKFSLNLEILKYACPGLGACDPFLVTNGLKKDCQSVNVKSKNGKI